MSKIRKTKRREWINAQGGDGDMHAAMLGEDREFTYEIPLHPAKRSDKAAAVQAFLRARKKGRKR